MDTKEIITLSSDEESDYVNRPKLKQNKSFSKSGKSHGKSSQIVGKQHSCVLILGGSKQLGSPMPKDTCKNYNNTIPEIVDLEEHNINHEKTETNTKEVKADSQISVVKNHSKLKITESTDNEVIMCSFDNENKVENKQSCPLVDDKVQIKAIDSTGVTLVETENVPNEQIVEKKIHKSESSESKQGNDIPQFFRIFIEFCSSLEEDLNDRARLIKKLEKRCLAAESNYVKSQEFRLLIEISTKKINKNNLYLIAKEITDELSSRKKIAIDKETNHEEVVKQFEPESTDEKSRKKAKIINKVMKRLDELGMKIRQLEETEVDLSDEEDSSYILLQRYRERFCQIYKKLCEIMNEPSDANRVYNRKICFSGSKYPAINNCIEKWLNKTKRFPDFSDIMKLLESQSSSLGLPSNRESIRATAMEIFQQVGVMLQRRRKYDLWDSFCGFLNDDKDPALDDPVLDNVLKQNFETRIKKEQEIFRYYAEKQEKDRLEPEEVPEEEANLSPVESGTEDEEIEFIEKSLNERVDVTIEEDQKLGEMGDMDDNLRNENYEGGENNLSEREHLLANNDQVDKEAETSMPMKESKNNYKNCKSIKWRGESRSKLNGDSLSNKNSLEETTEKMDDMNADKCCDEKVVNTNEAKNATDASPEGGMVTNKESIEKDVDCVESNESKRDDIDFGKYNFSKIPVIRLKRLPDDIDLSSVSVSGNIYLSPKATTRESTPEIEAGSPKRRKLETSDPQVLETDIEKNEKVFQVHRCLVEHDFVDDKLSLLDDFSEKRKHWDKGKIFKDLTNVGRLMELNGKRKKPSSFFSYSIFRRSYPEFAKFSWKKRFRLNYKLVGLKDQKCALSPDDKEGKSVGGDEDHSKGKKVENNSESGGDEGSHFFSGCGSGSEKDNDDNDENKKREKIEDDPDKKHDDEEEDEEETEDEMSGKDGVKNENESKREDCFNCPISEKNENKVDSTTESENDVKSGENHANLEEVKTSEPEQDIPTRVEPDSSVNSEMDERKETHDESEKLEASEEGEPEVSQLQNNDEKMEDFHVEEKNNGSGEPEEGNDAEAKEGDTETEEHHEKEEDMETIEEDNRSKESVEQKEEEPPKKEKPLIRLRSLAEMEAKVEGSLLAKKNKAEIVFRRGREDKVNERAVAVRERPTYRGNQDSEVEFLGQKIRKRKRPTTKTPSDEERVKKFLMHSPSSISIIPPKKLSLSKHPSPAALQALETLKGLKGISATRVRSKETKTEEDVVVIAESYSRPQTARKSTGGAKHRRSDMPVISSVHSIQSPMTVATPKILAVQGSFPVFDGSSQAIVNNPMKNGQPSTMHDSSSIRISSVWGSIQPSTMVTLNMPTVSNHQPQGTVVALNMPNMPNIGNHQPPSTVVALNMPNLGNQPPTESPLLPSPLPGCSFEQDPALGKAKTSAATKKRKKKPVEFVVLD